MRSKRMWAMMIAFAMLMVASVSVNAQGASGKVYGFQEVDVQPQYPGGQMAFANFMNQNIKYPKEAMKERKEGKVMVEFIVERDGTPTNFKVTQSVCESLDAEAIRFAKLLPKYSPGKKDGKTVRTRIYFPCTFRLK